MTIARSELEEIVRLVASKIGVLSSTFPVGAGSGDLDIAASGIDFLWPLRLPEGWRVCQVRNYDLNSWVWVVERHGDVVMIDVVEDPLGIGRYGFPTALVVDDGGEIPPHVLAVYLTLKRLRKGGEAEEWLRIGQLASDNWDGFRSLVRALVGGRLGRRIAEEVARGDPPDLRLRRAARRAVFIRRFRTPWRVVKGVLLGTRRWLGRALHPTGLFVVIAGPDGTGKSTVAQALPAACRGLFLRNEGMHWRPGLLPQPGVLLGGGGDPTRPHARPPHSKALSLIFLAYYWLDFLLGYWLRIFPVRARTGLVIVERGWSDMVVDARRYRLDVPGVLTRLLGRALPRPDLTLVLEAPTSVLRARKQELTEGELVRQMAAWRAANSGSFSFLDTGGEIGGVIGSAREAIVGNLGARSQARLGAGWLALPSKKSPRWFLPRGPRAAALSGISVYQPTTLRGLIGWKSARAVARLGGFRLSPRGPSPPQTVMTALTPYLPSGPAVSVMRSNHRDRYVCLIEGAAGSRMVAKVATGAEGALSLRKEARALRTMAPNLAPPLSAPALLAEGEGLLLLEATAWFPRGRAWRLPDEVAGALGEVFARSAVRGKAAAHGDCAPWNLLRTRAGWTLVDWEHAREDAPAFFDVFHYLIQSHVLLGRPRKQELLEGVVHLRGWVAQVLRSYSGRAQLPVSDAGACLDQYLHLSSESVDSSSRDGETALRARAALLESLEHLVGAT